MTDTTAHWGPRDEARMHAVSRHAAGLFLFVLAAQFMTVVMLAAAMAPGYDYAQAAISDLGAIPETAMLFNGSLVAVGFLNIVGGVLFWRVHGQLWLLGAFLIAGLGALGAGFVPLGASDWHGLFALLAFVFFNLQTLGSAVAVKGAMRWLAGLLGLLGLAYVVVMAIGDAGNPAVFGVFGHGGAERLIVYPPMLWLMALGGWLMAGR